MENHISTFGDCLLDLWGAGFTEGSDIGDFDGKDDDFPGQRQSQSVTQLEGRSKVDVVGGGGMAGGSEIVLVKTIDMSYFTTFCLNGIDNDSFIVTR